MEITTATFCLRKITNTDAVKDSVYFEDKPITLSIAVQAAIEQIAKMSQLSLRYEQTSNHVSFKEGNNLYIISDKSSFCNEFESECRRLGLLFQVYYIPKNNEQANAEIISKNYNLRKSNL